jgi:hypothetical protein
MCDDLASLPRFNPSNGVNCVAVVNPNAIPSPVEPHEPIKLAIEISSVKSKFRVTSTGTISRALLLLL